MSTESAGGLDRPVSGVILWAKTPRAARRWAEQFARRQARKEYWAIVEGDVSGLGASGRWDDWLLPPDASGRPYVRQCGPAGFGRARAKYAAVSSPQRAPRTQRQD